MLFRGAISGSENKEKSRGSRSAFDADERHRVRLLAMQAKRQREDEIVLKEEKKVGG